MNPNKQLTGMWIGVRNTQAASLPICKANGSELTPRKSELVNRTTKTTSTT
jgi:hypothetical protein